MKKWWTSLPEREQRLVKWTGIALAIFFYWLAIWRPLGMERTEYQNRIDNQRSDLAFIQAAAQEAQVLRQQPVTTGNRGNLSLLALAERSARSAGLAGAFRRGEPVGENGARIWLESAPFDDIVKWMELLEQRYGVVVDEAGIERTGGSGLVNATILVTE